MSYLTVIEARKMVRDICKEVLAEECDDETTEQITGMMMLWLFGDDPRQPDQSDNGR